MGLNDVKSNFQAIKASPVIAFPKKVDLLITQLETLDVLYLSDSADVTKSERHEAQVLYTEIENYINTDNLVLCL
ncbi:hypothetical protein [Alkalibacterium kapii]|uniref:Uncharacterized protein n=1 Tax=Alkalibacterium kapii TaxID=426704 RepID=A0A511AU20_9LACT|nr:hypothetical protein [Alkalibacterium kapii]GEK91212.1 hypothetical protein AKA01nite_08340 [Alkalibacterium kapii]